MRAGAIVHGKSEPISHSGRDLFSDLPQPLEVMRYHSLTVDPDSIPDCLEVTARTADGTVMALSHRSWPLRGVQFHPESIGTPEGVELLDNFLSLEAA